MPRQARRGATASRATHPYRGRGRGRGQDRSMLSSGAPTLPTVSQAVPSTVAGATRVSDLSIEDLVSLVSRVVRDQRGVVPDSSTTVTSFAATVSSAPVLQVSTVPTVAVPAPLPSVLPIGSQSGKLYIGQSGLDACIGSAPPLHVPWAHL